MKRQMAMRLAVAAALLFGLTSAGTVGVEDLEAAQSRFKNDIVEIWTQQQYESVRPGGESALAIHFELAEDWHFYADAKTAPGGMNLRVTAYAEELIRFDNQIFPPSQLYFDKSSGKELEVYSSKFTIFLPFRITGVELKPGERVVIDLKIDIEGAVCSDIRCRLPDFGRLSTAVRIIPISDGGMGKPKFILPDVAKAAKPVLKEQWVSGSVWLALGLAVLAGLVLNIMPCVWPVIPIIVMRVLAQAKESKARSIGLGLAFCVGILLFFAALSVLNIVLRVGFGTVFQWGDHFRNPAFVTGMALLMVVLALFMFGVFTIGIPASITGKSQPGAGLPGSVGTGFLAAVLATPCSFAILTAAFAWAQTQPLGLSTLAIMLIGLGMAAPYAILFSLPRLLEQLPKPGRWMELFKQAMGFVLLVIAVKLAEGLGERQTIAVCYYAVVLAFCVWMWGGWVSYGTAAVRKWTVRLAALAIVIGAGFWLLPQHAEPIEWQSYDASTIAQAAAQNRPVLVEFMADWCLTCKAVQKTVYNRKDIAALMEKKGVLAIRADTTLRDYPATIDLKEVYGEPAVPVSILFVPGRAEPVRLRGLLIGEKLKKLLEELEDK